MDSITFDQEWQRVAVDKAPMPSDQLADLLRTVKLEEIVAYALDAYPWLHMTNLNQTPPTLFNGR